MSIFKNLDQKQKTEIYLRDSIRDYILDKKDNSNITDFKNHLLFFVHNYYNEVEKELVDNLLLNKEKVLRRYSGRGKSWVKINTDNLLWPKVEECLKNSVYNKDLCEEYLDKFIYLGFAYIRYYRTSNFNCIFEIRVNGCLNSSKVKLEISHEESLELEFLEGTPISIDLEISEKKSTKSSASKKVIEIDNQVDIDNCIFKSISDII